MLAEFCKPKYEISDVKPFSITQQELLHIYEEGALATLSEKDSDYDFVKAIVSKKEQPTQKEIERYKLWLDQKYVSPYTGKPIKLSRLFTPDYEIEHIIPRSRYFDDSFSNKVICESEVNKLKDRMLGYEFIAKHHGEKVQLSMGETVEILSPKEYEELVNKNYKTNRAKMAKLLMDDIPDSFIERQLNDSRYISKFVKSLLSNIVREHGEDSDTSKNVITCNGAITDHLKKDWGLNDVWNHIVLPRFQRLNTLYGTGNFTAKANGQEIPNMPLELQRGFSKKRIDHRHHAMDAIVIACTTRSHVHLLNNEAAMSQNKAIRYQLQRKLRRFEPKTMSDGSIRECACEFLKPWPTFTADVEKVLRGTVVSIKKNLRVINKTSNKYQHFVDGKKRLVTQTKGDSWAIRKALHKDTVFGEINLRLTKEVTIEKAILTPKSIVDKELKQKIVAMLELNYDITMIKEYFATHHDVWSDVDLKKIKIYYFTRSDINPATGQPKNRYFASRFGNDLVSLFSKVTDAQKAKDIIMKITDTGIQKILLNHLESNGGDVQKAFSADGIEDMNRNITKLNGGKRHKPILKVRKYEQANKFAIGQKGNKSQKFVEGAKGTNLFFAVYENEVTNPSTGLTERKRSFATIPLNIVIERQKQGLPPVPNNQNGVPPMFVLSPNDFVYLPTKHDIETQRISTPLDASRIYKMVSSNLAGCFFVPCNVANIIIDKKEFSPLNKMERAITGEMVKETCVPLKVDRLGNIIELNGKPL